MKKSGHERLAMYGRGRAYSRNDCERLLRRLILDGALREEMTITAVDTTACYVRPGVRADDMLAGRMQVRAPHSALKPIWYWQD